MSKLIFFIALFMFSAPVFSQSVYPYEEIKLDKPSDYKESEAMALSASAWLLSTPYKKDDADRNRAFQFLVKWAAGNKAYDFALHGVILELVDEKELMTLFIPAMVKFCLENKALGTNARLIETSSVKTVLNYCNDPANNFTIKKKIRKRLESN